MSVTNDISEVQDDELLYRGILPRNVHENRVASATFKGHGSTEISVDRSSLCTPSDTLIRLPNSVAVAEMLVLKVRELDLEVKADPVPGNRAHALIIRDQSLSAKQWNKIAKKLANACEWAIPPE